MGRRNRGLWPGICILLLALPAWADTTITVDGDMSDWPTDGFSFLDQSSDMPPPWADITQVWVTDDNSSGDDGYLYLAIEFISRFRPVIGGNDVDIYIYLDIDGDGQISGSEDRVIEITEGDVTDGDGNLLGSIAEFASDDRWVEVAIPYSVLGLENGSDTFGIAFAAAGKPDGTVDASPEPGTGDGGFIIYDGAAGDDVEPKSVSLLGLTAQSRKKGVEVFWATASERRNAGFRVYRLQDDGSWRSLRSSLVPGLGDAVVGRGYRVFDAEGQVGDAYLIEDVDFEGRSHLHPLAVAGPDGPSWALPLGRARKPAEVKTKGAKGPRIASLNRWWTDQNGLHAWSGQGGLERLSGRVPVLRDGERQLFLALPRADRHARGEFYRSRPGRAPDMRRLQVKGACAKSQNSVVQSMRFEEQNIYYVSAAGADPFVWAWVFPGMPAQAEVALPGHPAGPARIRLFWIGLAGPHQLELTINGQAAGSLAWTGEPQSSVEVTIPEGLLQAGNNQIGLSLSDLSGWDMLALDRIEIEQASRIVFDGGSQRFTVAPEACVSIASANTSAFWLFDVTEPQAPRFVEGASASDGAIVWQNPDRSVDYLLVAQDAVLPQPLFMGAWAEQPFKAKDFRVDALVIAHPDLMDVARATAERYRQQAIRSLAVDAQTLFDHHSFGRPSPAGISAFLSEVRSQRQVESVLIMGSGSVDPNGYLGEAPAMAVPVPFLKSRVHGYEFAADAWYGLDADGQPVLQVGRLPFETSQEGLDWLAKTALAPLPSSRVLFLADDYDPLQPDGSDAAEASVARVVQACLPPEVSSQVVFKRDESDPLAALRSALDDSPALLNYFGHSFLSGWSSSPIWINVEQALALANPEPAILLSWSCFDGAFVGPWGESLAWAWVRNPTGGASAAAASTSLSDPRALDLLAEQVLCRLLSGQAPTLGQALLESRQALSVLKDDAAVMDLLESFSLLGDPRTPNPYAP